LEENFFIFKLDISARATVVVKLVKVVKALVVVFAKAPVIAMVVTFPGASLVVFAKDAVVSTTASVVVFVSVVVV
jgi:hypothetical protein